MKNFVIYTAIAIVLLGLSGVGAYGAQIDTCADVEALNHKWKTKYYADIKLDQPIEELECQSMQYKIAKAMDIIYLVSEESGQDFYGYVVAQIPLLTIELDEKFDGVENTHANAYYRNVGKSEKKRIAIYAAFFKTQSVVNDEFYHHIIRASTIVHESRHMGLKRLGAHVECVRGDTIGKFNCDDHFLNNWLNSSPNSFEILFLNEAKKSSISGQLTKTYIKNRITGLLRDRFNYESLDDYFKAIKVK